MRSLPALALLFGCQSRLFEIELDSDATTTVEAGTVLESLIADFGFGDWVSMDITAAEELKNQGVSPGDIDGVHLDSFTMSATRPDDADLAFIDTLSVSVEAPDLPRVLIASSEDFPEGQDTVALDVEDVDLTAYVVSQALTVTTEVTGRRPDVDTDVRAAFRLTIGVTAQGAVAATQR